MTDTCAGPTYVWEGEVRHTAYDHDAGRTCKRRPTEYVEGRHYCKQHAALARERHETARRERWHRERTELDIDVWAFVGRIADVDDCEELRDWAEELLRRRWVLGNGA